MPALSDTMTTGRLVRWLKQVGDPVKSGDTLAEVETDKAIMEIEAFHDGFLGGPLAPIDTDIPVRSTIAYINDTATDTAPAHQEASTPSPPPAQPSPKPAAAAAPAAPIIAPAATPAAPSVHTGQPASEHADATVRASPYARSLARDLGVNLATITPGADGIVPAAAVVHAFGQPPMPHLDAGPPYRMERLSSMREAMAKNMIASLSTPTFRVTTQVTIQALQDLAEKKNTSLTLLIARACAQTVKALPVFNAVYTQQGLARRERVDVAIAVDSPEGLITPVLRDAGERSLSELAADWQALRDKVKHHRLTPQEYQGGSFYLSNLGMFPAVHSFDAVLPLGAAAILCIGAGTDGKTSFTITCDHRVLSGADAARFLQALDERLTDPESLFA